MNNDRNIQKIMQEKQIPIEQIEPTQILKCLEQEEMHQLLDDVEEFLNTGHHMEYWENVRIVAQDELARLSKNETDTIKQSARNILQNKNVLQLQELETHIAHKLNYEPDIDASYWEDLLHDVKIFKARATLQKMYADFMLQYNSGLPPTVATIHKEPQLDVTKRAPSPRRYSESEIEEGIDIISFEDDRKLLQKSRLDVLQRIATEKAVRASASAQDDTSVNNFSLPTGEIETLEADEADFSNEVSAQVLSSLRDNKQYSWSERFKPRKPRYFNRVKTGYEWNKYNRTHYDYDNPPPRIVQGYKFMIFYPDLIDNTKAPTYQLLPSDDGDPNFAILRFSAGAPYEDLAFKIVNKEWEYFRGFKSSFAKGVLSLFFSFKRIFYRR